jgi:membrane-associated protease RseP (regulator of RpoE activity)
MKKYKPGDVVKIKTKHKGEIFEYEIKLAEDLNQKGRPIIGIGFLNPKSGGITNRVSNFFSFFKKPSTYYEPRFNVEFTVFIYNLIWWIAIINFSVALINMWPLVIFDGGRVFMLTIWGLTRSKKAGEVAFKVVTYLILGSLVLLMFGWFKAFF